MKGSFIRLPLYGKETFVNRDYILMYKRHDDKPTFTHILIAGQSLDPEWHVIFDDVENIHNLFEEVK